MSRHTLGACVLMFSAPFILLAASYAALPPELPVLRNPFAGAFAGTIMIAPKSVFTVFRVPLMNLAHGLMAGVMLSRAADFENFARRAAYSSIFTTLIFAVASKSDFEALEISLLARHPYWDFLGGWFTAGTVLSVVVGVGLALIRGRRATIPWSELRLTVREKITLASLFLLYVAMVLASSLVSHRA